MGDGGRPADLRGHMAEWPRDCHRTPRRRLLEDSALTAHGKGGRRGQRLTERHRATLAEGCLSPPISDHPVRGILFSVAADFGVL